MYSKSSLTSVNSWFKDNMPSDFFSTSILLDLLQQKNITFEGVPHYMMQLE